MQIQKSTLGFAVTSEEYTLSYDSKDKLFIDCTFKNGVGGKLFIGSGCDRDESIDELISIGAPEIRETKEKTEITFTAESTLWKKIEYTFTCLSDKLLYSYKVYGKGSIDNARFFEGFQADMAQVKDKNFPFFCGSNRKDSYHRNVKFFMTSSKRKFDLVYSPQYNSSEYHYFNYYENTQIRMDGTRNYLGGDWLSAPPPFQYMLGPEDKSTWVGAGLVVEQGKNNFLQFQYTGGERFGFNLTLDGFTEVVDCWQSPAILLQMCRDVYSGLEKYVKYLRDNDFVKKNVYRDAAPRWWHEPIFGGWGEQCFLSRSWEKYLGTGRTGFSGDTSEYCSQKAYEKMLAGLEEHGVNPTILIIDYRWFKTESSLDVDEILWPDMKGFIKNQHAKGRKIILWVSPWSYCRSHTGRDVPYVEHAIVDQKVNFELDIDTDVFYPAVKRDKVKTRKQPAADTWNGERSWQLIVDPLNKEYAKRVEGKIAYMLSADGLDADGLEFDYTHLIPTQRGTRTITPHDKTLWGVELFHQLITLYYNSAKKAKKDALIITQTFNPYFDDVSDMLRLNDIYTDSASVVGQFEHRAKIGHIVCPDCALHTDQHPMPSLKAWREYATFQPNIGNPVLYYVSGMETTFERFEEKDWQTLRDVWGAYHKTLDKKYGKKK